MGALRFERRLGQFKKKKKKYAATKNPPKNKTEHKYLFKKSKDRQWIRLAVHRANTSMRLVSLFINLVSLLAVVSALANQDGDGATTTTGKTTSQTTVWVTVTTNGALATVKSIYKQSFLETYTTATSSAASGSVGLGSISGSVGGVRTYEHTTVSGGAGVIQGSVYGRSVGMVVLIMGYLM